MHIVKKTMQHLDAKSGETSLIVASEVPQKLPDDLIKEALSRGLAVAVDEAAADESDENSETDKKAEPTKGDQKPKDGTATDSDNE